MDIRAEFIKDTRKAINETVNELYKSNYALYVLGLFSCSEKDKMSAFEQMSTPGSPFSSTAVNVGENNNFVASFSCENRTEALKKVSKSWKKWQDGGSLEDYLDVVDSNIIMDKQLADKLFMAESLACEMPVPLSVYTPSKARLERHKQRWNELLERAYKLSRNLEDKIEDAALASGATKKDVSSRINNKILVQIWQLADEKIFPSQQIDNFFNVLEKSINVTFIFYEGS